MPSSFCKAHSSTLGYSPHLPVSVYGTDTRMAPRGTFLGSVFRTSWLAFRLVSLSRLGLDPIFQRDHIPTRFARHFRSPVGRSLLRIPVSTPPKWCRNIDLLSIGYAFRPHLRVRLTLSGLTFLRKPWVFGGRVSRRLLATRSGIITSASSSRPCRSTFTLQQNAPLPDALAGESIASVVDFSPAHYRRRIP